MADIKKIVEYIKSSDRPVLVQDLIEQKFVENDRESFVWVDTEDLIKNDDSILIFHYKISARYDDTRARYAFFYKNYFFEFLSNELQIIFGFDPTEKSIEKLREIVEESFYTYYSLQRRENFSYTNKPLNIRGYSFRTDQETMFEAFYMQSGGIYSLAEKYPEIFYVKRESPVKNPSKDLFGIIRYSKKPEEQAMELIQGLLYEYLSQQDEPVEVKKLHHFVNRSDIKYGIPRPIKPEFVEQALTSKPYIFEIVDGKAVLKVNLESIQDQIEKNLIRWGVQKSLKINTGIVVLRFTGKSFPLQEANEYVNVRPIIYIKSSSSIAQDLEILKGTDPQAESEIGRIVTSLLPQGSDLQEWFLQNCEISVFEENIQLNEYLTKFLISKLHPVLNLEDDPDNLFKYSLNEKLKGGENINESVE